MSTMEVEEIMTERPIHPALGFTTNHAYVGQWLGQPRSITSFALISNDGRLLPHTHSPMYIQQGEIAFDC